MRNRGYELVLVFVWVVVAVGMTVSGWAYYRLAPADRIYSALHPVYGPAGIVGQGLGIVGSAMMIAGVALYGARKRIRWMGRLGSLKRWLRFHIFLCTLGPYLVVLHTTFKFGGIVSIAFWSMAVVVASGVFGRYVYARIPKTIQGGFLDLSELQARKTELLEQLSGRFGISGATLATATASSGRSIDSSSLGSALVSAARYDLARRARSRKIRRLLEEHDVPPAASAEVSNLVSDELRMEAQVALLKPFQRMFRYWHAFHLPLAILMFAILGVHVGVAILFGYTWIF